MLIPATLTVAAVFAAALHLRRAPLAAVRAASWAVYLSLATTAAAIPAGDLALVAGLALIALALAVWAAAEAAAADHIMHTAADGLRWVRIGAVHS